VKGMIQGNAKAYVKEAVKRLNSYGYNVQVFLLNAASMGVPQKRERVFFVCSRKELNFPKLKMDFNEKAITFGEIEHCNLPSDLTEFAHTGWKKAKQGEPIGNFMSDIRFSDKRVSNTIRSSGGSYHSTQPRHLSKKELSQIGSYPLDYNFKTIEPKYLIGMSVPPVMMAQISHQIYLQWFANHG
jgi:DNA (cytosine-5)-methyltransferase 1